MPVSNHTKMAVLGALSIAPMTGYAVRREIRDTLGQFWTESFGQIYPALAELERDGMIERRDADRSGASTFSLTAAGSALLRELLSEPPSSAKPRNGLLLRVFFGRHLGAEACRRLILESRMQAEAKLAQLRAAGQEIQAEGGDDAPYLLLTVLAGEHSARAAVGWADEALELLDAVPLPDRRSTAASPKERS